MKILFCDLLLLSLFSSASSSCQEDCMTCREKLRPALDSFNLESSKLFSKDAMFETPQPLRTNFRLLFLKASWQKRDKLNELLLFLPMGSWACFPNLRSQTSKWPFAQFPPKPSFTDQFGTNLGLSRCSSFPPIRIASTEKSLTRRCPGLGLETLEFCSGYTVISPCSFGPITEPHYNMRTWTTLVVSKPRQISQLPELFLPLSRLAKYKVCILECEGKVFSGPLWTPCTKVMARGSWQLSPADPEHVAAALDQPRASEMQHLKRMPRVRSLFQAQKGTEPGMEEVGEMEQRQLQKRFGGFTGARKSARKLANQKRFSEFMRQYLVLSLRSSQRRRTLNQNGNA
eukprot:bmy_05840T0